MKSLPLEIDRVDDLASQLAMLTAHHSPDMFFAHATQFRASLLAHRQSYRPVTLARRFACALLTARPVRFLHLASRQRAMLRLAANEATDTHDLYAAMKDLESAQERFSLGPTATHKQKLGWLACQVPDLQVQYAALVRNGEIADAPDGLRLHRARHRRHVAYLIFALAVGWEWFVFITMAIRGSIEMVELVAYMAGALLFSFWLTRDLFVALRVDQRTVEQVNARLQPQGTAGKNGRE